MLLSSFFFVHLSLWNREDGGTRLTGDASHPCFPGVREPAAGSERRGWRKKKTSAVLFEAFRADVSGD
jgi:hypothetical protein